MLRVAGACAQRDGAGRLPRPRAVRPAAAGAFLDEAFSPATHGLRQGEDCLCVAVTAPAVLCAEGPLPILVWIHGGSYTSGASDGPGHEPTSLVTLHLAVAGADEELFGRAIVQSPPLGIRTA